MTVDFTINCYTGLTYNWSQGGVTVSTDSIATGLSAGMYVVTITDGNACTLNTITNINSVSVSVPKPVLSNDTSYCENDVVSNMTALGSGGTINWYSDNSLSNLLISGNTFMPVNTLGTTTYYVNQVIGSCTSPFDSININIFSLPVVDLGLDTTYCSGDSLLLNAGNIGSSFSWSPGVSTDSTIYVSTPDTYIVNVTDTNGCSSTDSINITMMSLPVHNGIIGYDICFGDSTILISSGSGDLSWNNASTNDSLLISPLVGTWYFSSYSNSCGTITDSILIIVHSYPSIIAMGDTKENHWCLHYSSSDHQNLKKLG